MRCYAFINGFLFVTGLFFSTTSMVQADLMAHWNFDESSGNALDSAGSHDGTIGSGVVRVPGLIGSGALDFNDGGTVALGTRGATSFDGGITVETLVKLPADWILGQETGTTNISDYSFTFSTMGLFGFQKDQWTTGFAPHTPVICFGLDVGGWAELDMPLDGVGARPSIADLTDSNFHHIVGTYDKASGVKAIYVDGTLAMSINLPPGTSLSSLSADAWDMGLGDGRGSNHSVIRDEMAVYNHALTSAEVFAQYQSYVPEPSTIMLLLTGMAGLVAFSRRKQK